MSSPTTKRPIVLIVEDETLIRMDAVEMIVAAGYEVLEAANADQAIEILKARTDIAILFTDIQMPGSIDGLKLAHAVRHRWPPVKLLRVPGTSRSFKKNCRKAHDLYQNHQQVRDSGDVP